MKNIILAIAFLYTAAAQAVGDPPQKLNAQQAQATFASYKPLLNGCPGKQTATLGSINGGDSPAGGSQTIALNFDGGATVTVVTSWGQLRNNGDRANSSVVIKCSMNN